MSSGTSETTGTRPAADVAPLRLAHLYPALLNVAGDGGNLTALERRCAWRGIGTETVDVHVGDRPDLTGFDVVLLHGGQDVEMAVVAADLRRQAGTLRDAADAGVVVFAVCAGLQLLGHRYVPADGETLPGVGVLDLETRGGPRRFMQHAGCEVTSGGQTRVVVGFENHSGLTELGPGCQPFGRVVAGSGNNGRDGTEGARRDHVFATYLHGPVLPKNPWLADELLRIALERRAGGPVPLEPLPDVTEGPAHARALELALATGGGRTAPRPAPLVGHPPDLGGRPAGRPGRGGHSGRVPASTRPATAAATRGGESTPPPGSPTYRTSTACPACVATCADRRSTPTAASAVPIACNSPGRSAARTSRTVASADAPGTRTTRGRDGVPAGGR